MMVFKQSAGGVNMVVNGTFVLAILSAGWLDCEWVLSAGLAVGWVVRRYSSGRDLAKRWEQCTSMLSS